MVILIDTNVVLDFLLTRKPFFEASEEIMKRCADGELEGYIAFHSVSNLWYILRKVPEERRREWLMSICGFLKVAGASHEEVVKAIGKKEFRDFEDCLQDRCAKSVKAQYIVTRNVADFSGSEIPAVLPEDFLGKMS